MLWDALAEDDRVHVGDTSAPDGSKDRTMTRADARRALQCEVISQTAHGLSTLDCVRHDGTSYVEATADTAVNAIVAGVVVSVPGVDTFIVQYGGDVVDQAGLTAGSVHYLQDAGGLGTIAGTVEVPVMLATATTAGRLLLIGAGGGGGGGAVDSVFSRTGIVTAQASDYDASQIDNDSGVAGAFVSDALDTLAAGAGATTISTLLAITGTQVKLVYISANTRWEYPDGTVPTLTGRAASITWEGTSAQIPAQGTGDAQFQVGDTAFVRATSL